MMQINAHYLMWMLNKASKNLGVWGLVAIVIFFATIFFYSSKILPMQQEISDLNTRLHSQVTVPSTVNPVESKPIKNTVEEVSIFYQRFPDVATLPNWLEAIDEAAIHEQLALNRGDYKLNKVSKTATNLKDNALTRYEIMLPVKGSYIQIRKFIAIILRQLPMLALSDFQITRENVSSATVDANLLFVLFLKER